MNPEIDKEPQEPVVIGYTKYGKPIHGLEPGRVYTACVISCIDCGHYIRGMGGPQRGAKCVPCFTKEKA